MEYIYLLLTSAGALVCYLLFRRPDPRLPPFPVRPLPLVGNLLNMESDPRPLFRKWRNQCGDIFSLYMAGTLMVVLNGYDTIREALVKKADSFSDRPPLYVDQVIGLNGKGVVLSNGETWRQQRSASLSILKNFGMGKNILAEKIRDEIDCFMNYLATQTEPTNIRIMTNISVSNIISSIVIGQRFEYTDEKFQKIIALLMGLGSDTSNCGAINFIPSLQYLPGDIFKTKQMAAAGHTIMAFIRRFVEEKKNNYAETQEVTNFIDAYIAESAQRTAKGVPNIMDNDHLTKLIFDLFTVGSETSSTTISWCILYMLNFPDVQKKVHEEIEDVVGTSRAPAMQDVPKLTYLNAVILETQRMGNIAPLSVAHLCSEDTVIRDFTIPKGAVIVPNLDSLMYSEQIWGADVLEFKPDRFLDENGKLKVPDEFIPFGIGRRSCLGESLARMEIFMYFSSFIQRFELLPAQPGCPPPTECVFGIVNAPHPYQVRLVPRIK